MRFNGIGARAKEEKAPWWGYTPGAFWYFWVWCLSLRLYRAAQFSQTGNFPGGSAFVQHAFFGGFVDG